MSNNITWNLNCLVNKSTIPLALQATENKHQEGPEKYHMFQGLSPMCFLEDKAKSERTRWLLDHCFMTSSCCYNHVKVKKISVSSNPSFLGSSNTVQLSVSLSETSYCVLICSPTPPSVDAFWSSYLLIPSSSLQTWSLNQLFHHFLGRSNAFDSVLRIEEAPWSAHDQGNMKQSCTGLTHPFNTWFWLDRQTKDGVYIILII